MFVRAHQLETQGVAVPACTCLPKKMTLSSVASCRICRRRREARSYEAEKGGCQQEHRPFHSVPSVESTPSNTIYSRWID